MEAIGSGEFRAVLKTVFGTSDHLGFKALSVIPAWLQLKTNGGYWVATMFFGLFSAANIGWIWLIARRTGAGPGEALGAALVLACSNTMFYWSRHLVPYDVSLFWGLACLYVALKDGTRVTVSLLAGLLGLFAFVTYNGYWILVALVLTGHVGLALPNWKNVLVRAGGGLLGLVGGFAVLVGVAAALDANLLDSYTQFAGTINQGDYADGHRVIWEYFWGAEPGGVLLWIMAAIGIIAARIAGLNPARRGWLWLGGTIGVAAGLVVGSNLLEVFVVYGRLARQIVPFAALLAGYAIFGLTPNIPGVRSIRIGVAATLLSTAAWTFSTPLGQEFPIEFHHRSSLEIARLRQDAEQQRIAPLAADRFRFVNVNYIHPIPSPAPEFGRFRELRVRDHPLAYPPFLYEGYKREEREKFFGSDIRMKLIVLEE